MKNGVPPAKWTYENIAYMKRQMQAMGLAIDWSREIATCDPDYYKWNQWLFLRMLEQGIAYRKTQVVNWDPVDQTVLANEQVIDGRGWRTGALVEKREIPGYYLKITDYADELLACLDEMPGWPERVQARCRRTGSARARACASRSRTTSPATDGKPIGGGRMYVFTTRADTIMGVTFCAVAAEHPLALHAAKTNPALAAFIDECRRGSVIEADLATMEKKGMPTGLSVEHPLTGENGRGVGRQLRADGLRRRRGDGRARARRARLRVREEVRAADPAGDRRRRRAFSTDAWQPWYEDKAARPLRAFGQVRRASPTRRRSTRSPPTSRRRAWARRRSRSGCATGASRASATGARRSRSSTARRAARCPCRTTTCRSCCPRTACRTAAATRSPSARTSSPSPARRAASRRGARPTRWTRSSTRRGTTCATRAPDAPTMVDARNDYWMPMDQYIGGIEHAILHLLYARFWTKVMRDMGLVKFDEPFTRLLTQGMVLNHICFRRNEKGGIDYFPPARGRAGARRRRPHRGRASPQRRPAGRVRRRGRRCRSPSATASTRRT